MRLDVPQLSLVLLIGASSSGKSTFAAKHFRPTEVISSDRCRALVDDDENSMPATDDAFKLLHQLTSIRLERGRLTVIDATNVKPEDRKPLIALRAVDRLRGRRDFPFSGLLGASVFVSRCVCDRVDLRRLIRTMAMLGQSAAR